MTVTSATNSNTASALLNPVKQTSTTSKEDADQSKLSTDYESFLNLFLTQLKNQDPTEPLDTNQMTDQIVQFSQVEQQINTNKKLDALTASNNNTALTNSLAYVDKFVEWEGTQMNFNGSSSEFAYKLPTPADSVKITITDSSGKIVRTVDNLDGTSGKKNVAVWDGTDNKGVKQPVGLYNFKVTASQNSEPVIPKTYVTDYVTEVDLDGEDIKLHFGELSIKAGDVLSIKSSALYQQSATEAAPATTPAATPAPEVPPVVNQTPPTPTAPS